MADLDNPKYLAAISAAVETRVIDFKAAFSWHAAARSLIFCYTTNYGTARSPTFVVARTEASVSHVS
jgi:hypothetical protein